MKVYISGPMSGIHDNNKAAFEFATSHFRRMGHEVVSPIEMDEAEGVDANQLKWKLCLRRDISALMGCDAIFRMAGSERSEGATLELDTAARVKITEIGWDGKPVTQRTILDEAGSLTGGDRQIAYGHPSEDFHRTAIFWTEWLKKKLKEGEEVEATDVALMMVLLKISRERNRHKRDNLVDGAGYLRTAEMVYDSKE